MTGSLLDATQRHPLTLPDGQIYANTVYLNQAIDHPNIEIGDYTYYNDFEPVSDYAARIAPYLHAGAPEKLIIGKFGQFAHGVRFITSSADHPKDWFTTYPFAVFNAQTMPLFEAEFSKGDDTIIGNDVWIGHGAIILPGVRIGDGAIIGAGAVVKGGVPPYAVFAGNPAKQIKRRFDDEIIALLIKLQWWNLPIDEIKKILPVLTSRDFDALREIVDRR